MKNNTLQTCFNSVLALFSFASGRRSGSPSPQPSPRSFLAGRGRRQAMATVNATRFPRRLQFTLAAGLLFGALLTAPAVPVTFRINLSVQTALGNFTAGNGDTVLVAGNWDGYATTNTLTVSDNPDIYTNTLDLAAASWPNYKFVINPYGTASGSGLKWESPTSFGGGDRWFQVPAAGTNLPVVFFSDAADLPTYQVAITFQVDMSAAMVQGIFAIDSSTVNAFGSFDGWSTTGVVLTNVTGTSNYIGSFVTSALPTNSLVSYKYAINGYYGTWEGNVGAGGAQNRSFTLISTNELRPQEYWNNITNANVSYDVQFRVNMSVENALGNFTPGSDTVYVNGDWNWTGSALQLLQTEDLNVYTGTVALAYSPGSTINYKYAMNMGIPVNSWEANGVGPNGGNNRQFVLYAATNLPADFFNNLRPTATTEVAWAYGTNVNNRIRLQTATNLLSGWTDVPGTQGQSGVTNDFGAGPVFFRLIGP